MARIEKAACVIGWPVAHSRSPLIHNYWIKELRLDAEYRREAVPPDGFADFVSHLGEYGYAGANVTVPHKEAALSLSTPDERARAVGAANTLWLDEYRQLHSTNTDVEGFIANLDDAVPSWDRGLKAAMVLGAGGAARAVVFGLIERGVQTILLANRTPDRAIALQAQFGPRVKPIRWDQINTLLRGAGLVVNTTTLGMTGQPALVCDLRQLSPEAIVADIVYAPLDTALLKAARARGLRTADGLGMLLHQAVGGFERWFGVRPRVTADLRARIEAGLMRRD